MRPIANTVTGEYITALGIGNVTSAENVDRSLMTYGIKDEHLTNLYRLITIFKRPICQ